MKTFWQWLINEGGRRTGAKLSLYPLAYGDIGLYPPGEYITHSADAIYYLSREERKYYGQSGPPYNVLHLKVDYPENEIPAYKLPPDTSTQFKRMPSDDPTNTWKNLGKGRAGTPGVVVGDDSPDPKGG